VRKLEAALRKAKPVIRQRYAKLGRMHRHAVALAISLATKADGAGWRAAGRLTKAAKLRKKERFTSLLHHVSVDLLRLSFFALK